MSVEKISLVVDKLGTELSYIDSGAPPSVTSYTTIFAIHGWVFSSPIFKKVIELAPKQGLRFVAINRRSYAGSTAFTAEELNALTNGTDTKRMAFLAARGCEIATFMDLFIQRNALPPLAPDRQSGGVALLGWSLGCSVALSAISNIDLLAQDVQLRLGSYLQALILQEPPSIALGTPYPTKTWSPSMDTSIPSEDRDRLGIQWLTSYFKHGDIISRDPDILSYVVPFTSRVPSIFTMTSEEFTSIVDLEPSASSEWLYMTTFGPQFLTSYRKACFDKHLRDILPHMKVWEITGDATPSFSIAAFWSIQEDNDVHGGGWVNFRIIEGANHFMHWDEPVKSVQLYEELIS